MGSNLQFQQFDHVQDGEKDLSLFPTRKTTTLNRSMDELRPSGVLYVDNGNHPLKDREQKISGSFFLFIYL